MQLDRDGVRMTRPNRITSPTCSDGLHWQVTDDGSRTLWNEHLNETYHSGSGAVAESIVVYLKNSGVFDRLVQAKETAVLEYGLGTATAFLLTAATAIVYRAPLSYCALELSLLPASIVGDLQFTTKSLEPNSGGAISEAEFRDVLEMAQQLVPRFAQWRAELPDEVPAGEFKYCVNEHVELLVVVGDAAEYRSSGERFDAVYFDPFSPSTCPELWTRNVFQASFDALRVGGVFTSYCVKATVRRELVQVGFLVERLKGPAGGKREVLRAAKLGG